MVFLWYVLAATHGWELQRSLCGYHGSRDGCELSAVLVRRPGLGITDSEGNALG